MTQERETPKFQGIADPRCRCTPDRFCGPCSGAGKVGTFVIFRGKFREPWNEAVKTDRIKNGGEK